MKKTFVSLIVVLVIVCGMFNACAAENEQRYAEPQLGWVSVGKASVRFAPTSEEAPVAQLKNGEYIVIVGVCTGYFNSDQYYMVDMTFVGYPGEVGYMMKKAVHLGVKEYVTMPADTWAYAQESVEADGVAEISKGQQRLVLGETQVSGESWFAIQVDTEGNRGVGYVRKADVSDKFVTEADQNLLNQVRAGSTTATLPVTPATAQVVVASEENTAASETVTANNYVTVSEATPVFSTAGNTGTSLGTINPGDQVYVYQVGSQYSMVIFGTSFGYIENAKIVK